MKLRTNGKVVINILIINLMKQKANIQLKGHRESFLIAHYHYWQSQKVIKFIVVDNKCESRKIL